MEAQSELGTHIHCCVAALAAQATFLEQPKSFRPSQWIKGHSERQSLNRNGLRRQNLTRDYHTRQMKHSGWVVHQPCPRQYNYWEGWVMLVGFLRFCAYVLDVCAYNQSAASFQPTEDQSLSVSVCLDTITTRFLCCVSQNALLLTITFKKPFQNIFGNISIQWQCLGLSLSTIRYIYIWVSILRTFLTPSIRIGIFSISFILYYLIFCVSKNLFSGSAIYFIDQYLLVFSVYNEYIFTLTRALTGDFFFFLPWI